MSNLTAFYPNDFMPFSFSITGISTHSLRANLRITGGHSEISINFENEQEAHYFWRAQSKCAKFILEAGELQWRLQVVKTIQILISANISAMGSTSVGMWVGVAFFLNLLPSGIFPSEEQAMSSFHGLHLLLYLANFKIPTKNKYFAMSQ